MFTQYMLTRIYNRTLYDVYYTVCNKHWYMLHSEKCTYGTKWRANSVKWYLFISQVCTLCILFIVPCTMYMQFTLCTAYSIDDAWYLEIYTEQWSVYIIQYIFILSNLIHNPFELKCMLDIIDIDIRGAPIYMYCIMNKPVGILLVSEIILF